MTLLIPVPGAGSTEGQGYPFPQVLLVFAGLLALWVAIPECQREEVAVVTQAGGATAEVHPHQAKVLAGLPVGVVGDSDEAGQVGAEKWCRALHGVATEVRLVKLPYEVAAKAGKDVRDFLTEVSR